MFFFHIEPNNLILQFPLCSSSVKSRVPNSAHLCSNLWNCYNRVTSDNERQNFRPVIDTKVINFYLPMLDTKFVTIWSNDRVICGLDRVLLNSSLSSNSKKLSSFKSCSTRIVKVMSNFCIACNWILRCVQLYMYIFEVCDFLSMYFIQIIFCFLCGLS